MIPTKFRPFLNKSAYIVIPEKDQELWGWGEDVTLRVVEWTHELKNLIIAYYEDYLDEDFLGKDAVIKGEEWLRSDLACIAMLGCDPNCDENLEDAFNESSTFLFINPLLGNQSPVICISSDAWDFKNIIAKTCDDMIPIYKGKAPSWE